jgi:toxin HigB-1
VNITFSHKKLESLANNDKLMLKVLGKIRAKFFKLRLSQLYLAESLEDVRHLSGNFHELREDRKGQWACDLDQPYRLIFTPHENPIPVNENKQYIWLEILGVEVLEIVNYHKEK